MNGVINQRALFRMAIGSFITFSYSGAIQHPALLPQMVPTQTRDP